MGKPPSQPEPSTIHHFSHPHPLQLTNHQSHLALFPVTCSCCKEQASGLIYTCHLCKYFLHVSCSRLPQRITHPFDHQSHVLSLLPTPAYPEGSFDCDACGKKGSNGFSYHCGPCGIDLHTNCASMSMTIAHHSHHHQLNLIFSAPYPSMSFNCDLCGALGCKQWLYRCDLCEFDVHLDCAKMDQGQRAPNLVRFQNHRPMAPSVLQPVEARQYQTLPIPAVSAYQFVANPTAIRPVPVMAVPQQVQVPIYAPNGYMVKSGAPPNMNMRGGGGGGGNQQGNSLSDQLLLSVIDGVGQTIGQELVLGIQGQFDGSGGSGDGSGGGGGGGGEADYGAHGD